MKDFDRLITRFRQFGGLRLVWQYARMGVLWLGVKELVRCAVRGKSFKACYPIVTAHIDNVLVEKYGGLKEEGKEKTDSATCGGYVWFCWLQGLEHAPEMVRVCLASQQRMFGDRVVVLDDRNYRDWVTFPPFVEEKYKKGYIPGAMFSDLLRLELLIKYGGLWVDSSVLVNPTHLTEGLWKPSIEEIMESDLFVFRYFRKGQVVGMSNWLIHAKPDNPLLLDLRKMLYAYWRDYNCVVDYYIFHQFFGVVAKRYPQMMDDMPKGNSYHALLLRDCLDKDFDEAWWKKLTEHVCFHKLNYRLEGKVKVNPKSYWNHILQNKML